MADIVVVAASVLAQGTPGTYDGTAGETITAGQVTYLKTSDSRLWLAQSDGTAEEATIRGIALHAALAGQPLRVQTSGVIALGATLVLGGVYALSDTAGAICPIADVGASEYTSLLGIASTTAQVTWLTINIVNSGIEHA